MAIARCSLLFTLLVPIGAAAAQGRTWIVDAANGPGTHFTDLPPAEAAAAHGDVLRVRPGTYSSTSTSKGIALVGEPAFSVRSGVFFAPAVLVTGLPAGRTFTLRDMTAVPDPQFPTNFLGFEARACRGAVVVQRLDATASFPNVGLVRAQDCDLVTFTDCAPRISMGWQLVGGVTNLVRCTLQGPSALGDPRAGSRTSIPAVAASLGAHVLVTECTLTGGYGASIWPHAGQYHPSSGGVLLNPGSLRVAGGPTTIAAGGGVPTTMPRSAIDGAGSCDVDPSVALTPFAGAPPIAAGIAATLAPVAGLAASGGQLGAPVAVTLRSQPNDPYVLGAGLVSVPTGTALGLLCLDLNAWFVLAGGSQGASGATTWSVPLPADPALGGLGLTFQAASAGASLRLTNPASVVLR